MAQGEPYEILDETEELILGHIFEHAFLIVKATNEMINLDEDSYGDPSCGIIDKMNDWCAVGGSLLVIWIDNKVDQIKDADLCWIYAIRQVGKYEMEILTDPWAESVAIWHFNVQTKEKRKIRPFPDYKGKRYTDDVVW